MPKGRSKPIRKTKRSSSFGDAVDDAARLLRRMIYDDAKEFENKVAELFRLQGFRTIVDYKRDDMQIDVRLEMAVGILPVCALVECKNLNRPVTQQQIREFASKVEYITKVDQLPYQAILIARTAFANNAYEVAKTLRVRLLTFKELLLSLVDLGLNLEAAIRTFEGTSLQRLYVEQDAILEKEIRPGETVEPRGLTQTVLEWLDQPNSTFLALLGDFGCGKSSFCRRLAWDLAVQAKEKPGEIRMPILIDLREGGSTTVTLENLLTHHFQRLSNQPFNPQALLHLNREGYLLLIFDGFDETIAYTEPGRYLDSLRQILRAAEGKAKVLLTCRTHYFKDRPEVLKRLAQAPTMTSSLGATKLYEEIQERAGAEIGYVLEFREPQIEEYLKKALSGSADWRTFREQIRGTYNLEELAERPFLLEIIVKTLPRLLERGADVTIADLYETYCESWFTHTDSRLTLTRDHKVTLVEHLACLIWNSPKNRVHYGDLADKAAEFFQNRTLSVIEKERIDYEVRTALFLHRDSEGYYSFIHRSFLEFFIARTLREGLSKGNPECLKLKRITREVAFFLGFWPEAKQIPTVTGEVLERDYQTGISENALLLLYFHACASQGPIVGPGSEREDYQEIHKVFLGLRPKTLNLADAELEGARIPGIDLSGADLERAQLVRADLRQVSLDRARLSKAVLSFADLRQGSALEADFSGADLNHLDAQDANFRGTDLRKANLNFARFVRTELGDTKREGAQTIGTSFLENRALDLRLQFGHAGIIHAVAWSPDGRFIATGSADGTVKLWDAESGRLFNSLQGHESYVTSVAWASDGRRIASGSHDSTVKLWDAESGRLLNSLQGHENYVFSVAWAPDGQLIASGSHDSTVKLWDPESGRPLNSLQGHESSVFSVAWAPDGRQIASGGLDHTVKLWDAGRGELLNSFQNHENWVRSVAWAPDGRRIASGSHDSTVKLWDAESGRLLNSLQGHKDWVRSVAWAPDGQRIASGGHDSTVKLWDAESGRLLNSLQGGENYVVSVAWAPDGRRIASGGGNDNTGKLWDAESGRLLSSLAIPGSSVFSAAWAPDGRRIASGADDHTVKLWDAENGLILHSLSSHKHWVRTVAWAPDGRRIASGASDQTIKLWDVESGYLLHSLVAHQNVVFAVAWAPDGRRIASGGDENTVELWDAESGRLLNSLAGSNGWVFSVAWAPDGQRVAYGGEDRSVIVVDAESGQLLHSLSGHEEQVLSVAWAPDGWRIASGSFDHTVKLWDVASGRLLYSFVGHEGAVSIVAWSPDGRQIASASYDETVQIWRPDSGEIIQAFKISPLVTSLSWDQTSQRLILSFELGFTEIWDLTSNPPCPLARLYHTPGSGFAATPDGYVSGPPEALEYVRFGDGWALYDLTDVPERLSPERVAAALKQGRVAAPSRRGKTKRKG